MTEVVKLRPRKGSDPVLYTTQLTMRGIARRIQSFNAETKQLDSMLTELVTNTAPSLVGLYGVGTDTATSFGSVNLIWPHRMVWPHPILSTKPHAP